MRCDMEHVQPIDITDAIARHTGDRTLVYKTVDGEPRYVSYFFPADYRPAEKKYPVFFFIHGGGWGGKQIFDDQEIWSGDHLGYLARYYADKGFVSVSIDYRLSSESCQRDGCQLIDMYDDCMDAIGFVTMHAEEDGIDTEQAVVLGESAGGYLAAAVAAFRYRKMPVNMKLSVLVNPVTSLSDNWIRLLPRESSHPVLENLNDEQRFRALSPVYQIGNDTCPALLLHGEADEVVHPHHARDYTEAMHKAGREAEEFWLPDTNHAFLLVEYYENPTAAYGAIHRLNEELRSRIGR